LTANLKLRCVVLAETAPGQPKDDDPVPTEASLDHRTMRICFEELRRSQEISSQPNFLILLGNRYDWRPLPEEVSEDEFRRLE